MKVLSVCSGIEAASVAWRPLGWESVAFSEVDAFPSAVLRHYYPDVPNWGDMTRFKEWPDADIDLLVGGTPCQSFSVAGLRAGLDDPRGSLMLVYLAIARRYRPRWLVWENVPGVLSADDGRAFGSLLGGLAELGYGFAYRVLDAQYFGLAQRRKRVFVVGHLGDWHRAAAVLFERASLSGHPAPRREAGEAAPTIPSRRSAGGGLGTGFDCDGGLIPSTGDISHCLNAGGMGRIDYETETLITHGLRADGFDASADGTGRGTPLVPTIAPCLTSNYGKQPDSSDTSAGRGDSHDLEYRQDGTANAILTPNGGRAGIGVGAVAFDARQSDVIQYGEQSGPLDTDGHTVGLLSGMQVRRLTPRECERLQGFPDDTKSITIRVCRNEDERHALARSAVVSSAAPKPEPSRPVAVDVLIDLERQHLQLRSLGRSNWSVSFADAASASHLPIPVADFARLVAATTSTLARETRTGEVASLLTINRSLAPWDGSVFVHLCGREIEELASDAERFTTALNDSTRFITSEVGRSSPSCEPTWRTLCSCVSAAIASSIPDEIRAESSYDLRLTTVSGYTLILVGKGMSKDGPRYKALGNSMAVPCMYWIGRRIQMVEEIVGGDVA